MWRFTAINFLCRDMEQLNDITRPADRIRQDVSRSPGGDSRIFHNTCVGCHSGMDPMAGAFAYYEWDATADARRVHARAGAAQVPDQRATTFPVRLRHDRRPLGQLLARGPNSPCSAGAARSPAATAPKSLGDEVGASRAFSVCQVEKVFAARLLPPPAGSHADRAEVQRIADVFEAQQLQHEARLRGDRRVLHGEVSDDDESHR